MNIHSSTEYISVVWSEGANNEFYHKNVLNFL